MRGATPAAPVPSRPLRPGSARRESLAQRNRRRQPRRIAPPFGYSAARVTDPRPSWTDAGHPSWSWLLFVCAVATVFPLWVAPSLPFTDLPQHVAAIATLRHFYDPQWKAQEYFTLALGRSPYLLYYLAGALLA